MLSSDLKWAVNFFKRRGENNMRFFYGLPQEAIRQQLGEDVNLDDLDYIAEHLLADETENDADFDVRVITTLKDGMFYIAEMKPENEAKYGDGKILQAYTEKIIATYRERYIQPPSPLEGKIEEARRAMKMREEKKLRAILSDLAKHEKEMDASLQVDFWELQREAMKKPQERTMPLTDWPSTPKYLDTDQDNLEDAEKKWSSRILTIEEIRDKIHPVCQKYGIKAAYVFGDYAEEDEADENSTVDIHIETGENSSLRGLFSLGVFRLDLTEALNKDVHLLTRKPEDCTLPPVGYFGKEILVYAE